MAKVQSMRSVNIDVPLPLGGVATVKANGVLSTSSEHAAALLEQPENWQPVKEAKSSVKEENEEDK